MFGPPLPAAHTDAPTRFLTDTIFPLIGGPVAIQRLPFADAMRALPAEERDKWQRQLQNAHAELVGRTVVGPYGGPENPYPNLTIQIYQPDPDQRILSHEAGHVADARGGLFSEALRDSLRADRERFHPASPQQQRYASNDDEFLAQTFNLALQALRRGDSEKQVAQAERDWPGLGLMYHVLRGRPPFAPGTS